jgi:hypothetical protein
VPFVGTDAVVRDVIVPVVIPVPASGPAPAAAVVPSPLDPRGRSNLPGEAARGVGDWAPGDALPEGVPHVTLDPVAYGLPEPPPGEKYARVGNEVLRIDAATRRVAEVVAR